MDASADSRQIDNGTIGKSNSLIKRPASGSLIPIMSVIFVDFIGLTSIVPLLPFFAKKFGASPSVTGLLFSTYSLCQMIGGPILGRLSDLYGRKRLMMLSQLGSLASYLLMAAAQSLPVLFFARALDGITGGNTSLAYAYVADVTLPEQRTIGFGKVLVAYGIGYSVGPALSGILSAADVRYPLYAAAGFSTISFLLSFFLLDSRPGVSRRKVAAEVSYADSKKWTALGLLRNSRVRMSFGRFFLFQVASNTYFLGLGLYCEKRFTTPGFTFGARENGYVYALTGVFMLIVQLVVMPYLAKRRVSNRVLLPAGFCICASGYALLHTFPNFYALIALVPLIQVGNGILRPTLWSLLSRSVDKSAQGLAMGMNQTQISVANMIGPAISGVAIQNFDPSYWPLIPFSLTLLSLVLLFVAPPEANDT